MHFEVSKGAEESDIYAQIASNNLKKGALTKFIVLRDPAGAEHTFLFSGSQHIDAARTILAEKNSAVANVDQKWTFVGGGKIENGTPRFESNTLAESTEFGTDRPAEEAQAPILSAIQQYVRSNFFTTTEETE